ARDPAPLLVVGPLHDDRMRSEQVDMHGGRRGHAAAMACHLVHHNGGFGDAETGAAILLGHGDAEPASIRHRAVEFARELTVLVARQPVFVVEARDHGANTFADRGVIFRYVELIGEESIHWSFPPRSTP